MTLLDFILQAKVAGYASGGEGFEKAFEDGSKGFEFTGHGYRYVDRYYGFNSFIGTEHIYTDTGSLLWGMNYFGEVLPGCAEPGEVYAFLKEAMLLISPEYPFRGPALFEKGLWRYENQQHGTVERFHGTESIFKNNQLVYILYYHGGQLTAI